MQNPLLLTFSSGCDRCEGHTSPSLPRTMAKAVKSFYDLTAVTLDGDKVDFNVYRGRVVLIENVASL